MLESCLQCKKRSFSPQHGVVCSLTMEIANFNGNCAEYVIDEERADSIARSTEYNNEAEVAERTRGWTAFGVKSGSIAGILTMSVAILWLVVGLFFGYLFYYPIILFFIGFVTMIKGIRSKTREKSNDLLD
jgi:hypothetical protein